MMSGQGSIRPGDWICGSCQVNNFAYRRECFRCKTVRSNASTNRNSRRDERYHSRTRRDSSSRDESTNSRCSSRGSSRCHSDQGRKREHPIGFKALEKLLEMPSEQVVMQLQMERSGYDLLLQDPDSISVDKMCLLMQVLAKASETRANKESLNIVFTKTFKPSFISHLVKFSVSVAMNRNSLQKATSYFDNLCLVLDKFAHAMPSLAKTILSELIETCIMCLKMPSFTESSDLIKKYDSTKSYLEKERKKWHSQDEGASGSRTRGRFEDSQPPPDDFREIPVMPTAQELADPEKPFLRRNIIQGKYLDVDHYLDVQFRLLREDFVRPLRNGIQEFKSNVKSQNRDLYIYKDVQIVGTEVRNFSLNHIIKINLPKHFRAENSKRLLFGNLVCFSNDNFKSILFGSISERKIEMLKNGFIGVKFDSEVTDTKEKVFVMAESRSYFTAYKHVLKALQKIDEDTFPMEDFIVHVDSDIPVPDYLEDRPEYDLQVMRSKDMMKASEMYNPLFPQNRRPVPSNYGVWPALQRVFITGDMEYWPSCDALAIDESQRRALKSALTSKLSIIQGPPGTGKTFLGLKIAQVLLHNSEHWKNDGQQSPILVVCFTNHALDQFLEGMTPYTNSIVRVGSRTKSEVIEDFQINTLVRNLRTRREIPNEIHQTNAEMLTRLRELEFDVKIQRKTLTELREPPGILQLQLLLNAEVIRENAAYHLQSRMANLLTYLLDPKFYHCPQNRPTQTLSAVNVQRQDPLSENDDSEHIWHDAEELFAEEENLRKLDEDDFADAWGPSSAQSSSLAYDVMTIKLEQQIQNLQEQKQTAAFMVVMEIDRKLDDLHNKLQLLRYGLSIPLDKIQARRHELKNIESLGFEERWNLYKLWLHRLENEAELKLVTLEQELEQHSEAYKEVKDQQCLYVMRHASVVGMTTTGAAQYTNILQALQPPIVIIEEAAEILEAHVVTSLTEACQHLIMIGDHQQLQPSATVYELAINFGLETSLFERMIKNDIAYETLEYQHRMRPGISRLLVPSIYPQLKDHDSVHLYPHVKGMKKDVFFITHKIHEAKGTDDNSSRENPHEAQLIMALCRHLMLQGYSADDITVLTPYTGQFFLLRKLQRRYEECQGVRISVVDNFQGEENKIILLSLVRSNEEGKVGFLSKDNRVCVALSRAKHGLYVTGNMKQLQESSNLWKKIYKDLLDDEAVGSSIVLQCQNHPDVLSYASTAEDIISKSPEGGCMKPCSFSLPMCGHKCPKICHMTDPAHAKVKCNEKCPKIICERNHPCPQKCWEVCSPCVVMVSKTLPCGHVHKVRCCEYNNSQRCPTQVTRILPDCQHETVMRCYQDPQTFPCPKPCEIRPPCGHKCKRKCHVTDDPNHIEYQCEQPCPRSPEGCTQKHECKKACYEDCGPCIVEIDKKAECGHSHRVSCSLQKEDIICNRKCKRLLSCGHHCPRKCKDECGGCTVKVKKKIMECQHEIEIECGKVARRSDCRNPCVLNLPCGHRGQARCQNSCTMMCNERVISSNTCPKGHQIKMPCYLLGKVNGEAAWTYCSEPCGALLDCKHYCKGKCGSCLHGRLHIACSEKCERPLVCGHICKADCSSVCPPCQAECPFQCEHSRCIKKCGKPCNPCQERCERKCKHQKCKNKCGEECTENLCEEPCSKTLKCGHPCVGYCGDPCPPLCRICDKDTLTEILFGSEDEEDARFVWLENCGHTIEADGLRGWLSTESEEIGMKLCPRCKQTIYNNRRNQEFILKAYENVRRVKDKYYSKRPKEQAQEIKTLLEELGTLPEFEKEVKQIRGSLPAISSKKVQQMYSTISDNEITLHKFQVQVLKKLKPLFNGSHGFGTKLEAHLNLVKKCVMDQKLRIAPQMIEEITCELQRASILPSYWKFLQLTSHIRHPELLKIKNILEILLDPTVKFVHEQEGKVKRYLKESEKYIGGLGITNEERLEILQAMNMKQGHWYKCKNGHVYCITECGGAMEEAKCPECGVTIGGSNHALRSDNAVATEMDGARHPAWSQHYNNMGNFNFDIQ